MHVMALVQDLSKYRTSKGAYIIPCLECCPNCSELEAKRSMVIYRCNIMITCTMLCGECALISDRHVQSSSCWGVQCITFGDEDGDYRSSGGIGC